MTTTFATETEAFAAVCKRFAPPAWAVFAGVANGTGSRANRWADAIAMSVWPSRGLEVHGFEIKVSRNDVLRELKDPAKAEAIASYCDRWWLVVGSSKLIREGELPPTWGLLVPHAGGLKAVKEAPKLKPKALDRSFVAAILRRAAERFDEEQIRRKLTAELRAEIRREIEEQSKADRDHQQEIIDELRGEIGDVRGLLHEAAGRGYSTDAIRKAIELLLKLTSWDGGVLNLDQVVACVDRDAERLRKVGESVRDAAALCRELQVERPR